MEMWNIWIKCIVVVVVMNVTLMEISCWETVTESYNQPIETTYRAERSSKNLTKSLAEDHQARVVQRMTDHRLQMMLHGERTFGNIVNVQWQKCVDKNNDIIKDLSHKYGEAEVACSKLALANVKKQGKGVKQVLKQISEWRKGYKYLIHLCKEKHSKNKPDFQDCLNEYIQKDNYDEYLSKLMTLLGNYENTLKITAEESLNSLDNCLDETLSQYIENVRILKTELDICYKNIMKEKPKAQELKRSKCSK